MYWDNTKLEKASMTSLLESRGMLCNFYKMQIVLNSLQNIFRKHATLSYS